MTPFEELLGWHLSCGLVHSTPEVFLLAQECHWTGAEMISRRGAKAQGLLINAWFVELAAATCRNPMREFLRVATHPHKFVLWCRQAQGRKHDIHSYKWNHLARRVNLSLSPLCASAPLRENQSITFSLQPSV